jgi:hypothetical protein
VSAYQPANLKRVDYPSEKVIELSELAAKLGVLIHIQGIPFGASHHETDTARVQVNVGDRHADALGRADAGSIAAAGSGKI